MTTSTEIRLHRNGTIAVGEIVGEGVLAKTAGDLLSLAFDARRAGAERVAIHVRNIEPRFFDLKTGVAGEMLQKLVNYRITLAVVGDISEFTGRSESFAALVRESNRGRDLHFVATIADACGTWP